MAKNILQDVVPSQRRRSIRDIQIHNREIEEPILDEPEEDEDEDNDNESPKKRMKENNNSFFNSKVLLWILGIVCILVLVISLSNVFYGATVTITPLSKPMLVNQNLTAKIKPVDGELGYTVLSLMREKEISVPADAEEAVETRASGKIIIYNSFSTTPQKLIKNTRFQTSKGLIYKIQDSISIPGKHVVDGRTIPGSIEVTVFADATGADYNIGLVDFTVPGFKSDFQRYTNFYAKSKTPMTGGKIGNQKTISDEKALSTKSKLDKDLLDLLLADAKKSTPENSIFYPLAYQVTFDSASPTDSATADSVNVKESAKFTAYFINRNDLSQHLAKKSIDGFNGLPVDVPGLEDMSFQIDNSASTADMIVFSLKGNSQVVWKVDKSRVAIDLVGKNKAELSDLVTSNTAIAKADAVIRPFWKSEFPSLADKIKVEVLDVKK